LIPFGIALLFAGLFFQGGDAQSPPFQATAIPTRDPLVEPTLPANPTQADRGAQVYWLSCLPCHGDLGQGLTDEFRATYPEEEQDCWKSGCHGKNPYDSGFTLPKTIPAVIGDTTLAKFSTAAQLNAYIRVAMPFWKPGSLSEADVWEATAFILRENKLWDDTRDLDTSIAADVAIPRAAFLTPVVSPESTEAQGRNRALGWVIIAGALAALFILLFILKKTGNTTKI